MYIAFCELEIIVGGTKQASMQTTLGNAFRSTVQWVGEQVLARQALVGSARTGVTGVTGRRDTSVSASYNTVAVPSFPSGLPHVDTEAMVAQCAKALANWGFERKSGQTDSMFVQACVQQVATKDPQLPSNVRDCLVDLARLIGWQLVSKLENPQAAWKYISEWANLAELQSRPARYEANSKVAPRGFAWLRDAVTGGDSLPGVRRMVVLTSVATAASVVALQAMLMSWWMA